MLQQPYDKYQNLLATKIVKTILVCIWRKLHSNFFYAIIKNQQRKGGFACS